MLIESSPAITRSISGGQAFWWKLTDNAFRHFLWFLVPIVAMTAIGVNRAANITELYYSSGTLSATTNPFVPDQPLSGVSAQLWESPASATSRTINEQLRTNSFLMSVVEEAGLGEAVEGGLLDLAIVRSNIWTSANGQSILTVNAQWTDPQTSYAFVNATISQYRTFLENTAASDSTEAERFYQQQLDLLRPELEAAEADLTEYVSGLPEIEASERLPISAELNVERLTARVESVESKIDAAQAEVDRASLVRSQQTTEAIRSLNIIDQPRVPTAPASALTKRATLVITFFLLGVVIAAVAVLITTVLDQTIASPADLLAIPEVLLVATVPPVRFAQSQTNRRRFGRSRRKGRPEPTEKVSVE